MAVIKDILEFDAVRTATGWEDVRIFLVNGLTNPDPMTRKWEAFNQAEIPAYGAQHPRFPGATVTRISVGPYEDDPETYAVRVEYGGDSVGTQGGLQNTGIKNVEISTSTTTVETIEDRFGNKLVVNYEGEPILLRLNSIDPPREVSWLRYQSVFKSEYQLSVLRAVVTVERPLPSLTDHLRFKMKTNKYPWSGQPAQTWLILGVDSSPNQSGNHDHRYQLAHTEGEVAGDGWRYRAEVGKGISGRGTTTLQYLAKNATIGNGIELFEMYEPIDFAQLGFTIPI